MSNTWKIDKLTCELFYNIDGKMVPRNVNDKQRYEQDKFYNIFAQDRISGNLENINDMRNSKGRFMGTKHLDLQGCKGHWKSKNNTLVNKLQKQINNIQNYTDGFCTIYASNDPSKFAIIDPEDFEKVAIHKWSVFEGTSNSFYFITTIDGTRHLLHRYVLNLGQKENKMVVNHIDQNSLNCRKNNLQLISHGDNLRKTNKTNGNCKYRGVFKTKWNTYYVFFTDANGVQRRLKGSWECAKQAAIQYDKQMIMMFPKENLVLNKDIFPYDFRD